MTCQENIVVIGHGQLGYSLFDRLDTFSFQVSHLSHGDSLPEKTTLAFFCVPAKFMHKLIQRHRRAGYRGVIVDTSQKAEILPEEVGKIATGSTNLALIPDSEKFEKVLENSTKNFFGYAKSFGDVSAYDIVELDRESKVTFTVASSQHG